MTDLSAIAALKHLLPKSWYAFLARFGTPTPIQLAGIPVIMKGRGVLLISPTASGKTETYAAPMAERIQSFEGPRILSGWIISPTRALVNDLARRLEAPLGAMGLRVGRRTGEHREISGSRPPHLVVTTPESLDSILSRYPLLLSTVRFLVLDEVHMLDGTPRGDHLACLVSRVRRIQKQVQVIASSATVEDPGGLALRYVGPGCEIVTSSGNRPIEARFIHNSPGTLARALCDIRAKSPQVRKILVFVQRRADTEMLFSLFKGRPPFGDAVFLHHGSLSRARRESVEKRMLTGTSGLCFSTTTLEVGIDIGDIDLIILTSPPPDVSALLQRIGRGNRRNRITRVCCLTSNPGETLRYQHLLESAEKGLLLGGAHGFCPSVLAQQCMSLLMQTPGRWITAEALVSRMPDWLRQSRWAKRLPELLDHLVDGGWLIKSGPRYMMGDELEEAFEKGRIHSNIENGAREIEVVDQDTRQVLGTLPRTATEGGSILLSGRNLKVSGSAGNGRVLVRDTQKNSQLKVSSSRGPIIQSSLAEDFARFAGLEPGSVPMLVLGNGSFGLLHFLGSLWGVLLALLITRRTGMKPVQINAFCMQLPEMLESIPTDATVEEIRTITIRHRIRLRNRILEGGWASRIPSEWRQAHLLDCIDMEGFLKRLKGMALTERVASSRHEALIQLAARPANFFNE